MGAPRVILTRLRRIIAAMALALGFTGLPGCAAPQPTTTGSPNPPPMPPPTPRAAAGDHPAPPPRARQAPSRTEATRTAKELVALVAFHASAFPYRGKIPDDGKPFLDVVDGTRRGHTSARGGIYWEDDTYADRRVLLAIPQGFDPHRPAVMVVFFHGNLGRLERDVRDRQQVVRQVAESGLNAVLVAPQLAVDALDSSAGHFWDGGFFNRFLDEAGARLAEFYGGREEWRGRFETMPVVVVAYSGGYLPAVYSLTSSHANGRVHGVVLLDALYGEEDKVAGWIRGHRHTAFFVSVYGSSARDRNTALQRLLAAQRIAVATSLPQRLDRGRINFVDVGDDVVHGDFVTQAWDHDPLRDLLSRIAGFARHES